MKKINWSLCESSEDQEHTSSVFLEGIKDCFLFQYVREPIRFRKGQITSILDLSLTNEENKIDYYQVCGKVIMRCSFFNFNRFID